MRLQDLDHNTVDDFVDTLNDIIDSIQEILDNEEVVDTVLIELQKLIGRGFDHDDIYCCFDNGIEVILSKVEGRVSNFEGHGMCQLWNVYYNDKDSEIYDIWVDEDDIIVDIY